MVQGMDVTGLAGGGATAKQSMNETGEHVIHFGEESSGSLMDQLSKSYQNFLFNSSCYFVSLSVHLNLRHDI